MPKIAPFITHDGFQPRQITYGFFGAKGGVSTGIYDSLNCGMGSDDDKALVQENRQIAAHSLGANPQKMASVYQIHSAEVITITDEADINQRPKADGLVTALPEVALSILTADCTPIIFADEAAGIIGACHAGWRGAASGIIQNTVKAMCAIGADTHHISAVIGPTIARPSYQIGQDMKDEVLSLSTPSSLAEPYFFADNEAGKFLFDLPGFTARCLSEAGITQIFDVGRDTYSESDDYFSHRRATHHKLADSGRQITLISKSS